MKSIVPLTVLLPVSFFAREVASAVLRVMIVADVSEKLYVSLMGSIGSSNLYNNNEEGLGADDVSETMASVNLVDMCSVSITPLNCPP